MDDIIQAPQVGDADPRKLRPFLPKVAGREVEAEGVDLREVFAILRRRIGVITGCTIVLMSLATVGIYQLTPRYTAQASLMLEQQKLQLLDIKNVLSGGGESSSILATQVDVITSPRIAEKVAANLHLETVPEFNPALRPASGFEPIAWAQGWLSSLLAWQYGAASAVGAPTPQVTSADVAPALAGRVQASNDGVSLIIRIRAQSESPELAAKIANAYVDVYLNDQLEAKFDATRRASAWLNEHLTDLRQKVQASERAVQLFKEQNNLSQSGTTVTGQQLSELNSQLIIATADRAQKEAALREMRGSAASPLVDKLKEQEAELLRRQAELSTRYKPEHPAMVNLAAQLQDVRQKITQEQNVAYRALLDQLNVAKARETAIKNTLDGLQHSTTAQDKAQVQLGELAREAQANKALYEDFLNRFKQTSVQEDIQQPDARPVAVATPPGGPSYPNKTLYLSVALAVSLFAGILVAIILERLDNGFRTSDQLEKIAGVATLGMVPQIPRNRHPAQVVVNSPVAQYSEAIRSVRTALRYSHVDDPPKIVLVTSSLPSEGKTVFAASLAFSVARSGSRALLVDCDLRRPEVARVMGVSEGPGLVDLFDGSASPEQIIRVDEKSGAHFISAKSGTANPQDLLGSQQMRTFLEKMRSHYDLIVLDSPPVLAVSDAIILSHSVDTTMFIVRWESTPRQAVMGAVKMLRTNGGHLAGVVLSRVNTRRHASYGYGDSAYYYGRSKGYYSRA